MIAFRHALSLMIAFGTAGCASSLNETRERSVHPEIAPTRVHAQTETPRFENAATLSSAFATLGDDALVVLIDRALTSSPEVRASVARVRASWALADQGRGARMPTVAAMATASMGSSITGGLGSVDARSLTLSLPVSYEVDLFGRFAQEHESDRFDAEATEADAETAALSLAAEVAEAYWDVVRARALARLLTEQKTSAGTHLTLVEQRQERGLVGDVDVFSQRRVVASLDADLALLVGTELVARRRLAALLGTDELPEITADALVTPPELVATELDASALAERPDIRAAWLRLESADASVAASVRSALPTLRLTATPGWTTIHSEAQVTTGDPPTRMTVERSGSGFVWSIGATLNVPIFDGLRTPSLVRERRARIEASLAEYEMLLLTARAEVENALVLDAQRRIALRALTAQRELAAQERASADTRYRAGLDSHVAVLIAMDAERALARAELEAIRALLSHRVQLVRALGGMPP